MLLIYFVCFFGFCCAFCLLLLLPQLAASLPLESVNGPRIGIKIHTRCEVEVETAALEDISSPVSLFFSALLAQMNCQIIIQIACHTR